MKNPYVLEFLGLPEVSSLQEKQLEAAIITHRQNFLLELGRGFAFVARQKRLRFEDTDLMLRIFGALRHPPNAPYKLIEPTDVPLPYQKGTI